MLKKIYVTEFEMELLSGLHIGGSSDSFDIGGADSTVIKNPLTNEPYIPGSSIKGKLRALLTQKYGILNHKKTNIEFANDQSGKILLNIFAPVEFGENNIQVTKAIFRDAYLTEDSKNMLEMQLGPGIYTEIKAENSINLLNGTAANPRFIERVPAGVKFVGEIILQVYDGDNEDAMKAGINEALDLLELNYIGNSGTRGYGRVKISKIKDMQEVKF